MTETPARNLMVIVRAIRHLLNEAETTVYEAELSRQASNKRLLWPYHPTTHKCVDVLFQLHRQLDRLEYQARLTQ